MLRTRLYLGLLPLLLILVGTGVYAIRVNRELGGSLARDLVNSHRAVFAGQQMRVAAVLMNTALGDAQRGDVLAARRAFDEQHAAFMRELMGQSATSAGQPRTTLVTALHEAFQRFDENAEQILRSAARVPSLAETRENATAASAVTEAIENLTRFDAAAAQQIAATVEQRAMTTERVLLPAIIGAFLLSVFVGWWLAASLLRPLPGVGSRPLPRCRCRTTSRSCIAFGIRSTSASRSTQTVSISRYRVRSCLALAPR